MCWASNQKVVKPWFDSWCGIALLYPWGQAVSSLPVTVTQPDKRPANITGGVRSGMADKEHNALYENNNV